LGLYGRDAKPRGGEKAGGLLLPAAHDGYHLKVDGLTSYRYEERNAKPAVGVFITGDTRALVTLRDVDGLDTPRDGYSGGSGPVLTAEKRIHYVPRAEALVTVSAAADKLFVRRLNIDETIEATGVDYLYVKSLPVADAERGSEYVYPVVVKSKKGGAKVKLESGPDGMKVMDTTVRWRVPVALAESEARVVLTVSDATGQEVLHSFAVRVHDAGKAPKPAAAAKPVAPGGPGKGEPMVALKPAPPAPSAVRPPALKDDKVTVKLPSPAAQDACFGGGGRFLILRLPGTQKLAVFDVNEAKVVKYIAIAEADAKFAAGLSHLIVALPGAGAFQRWSLTTFEKEATVASPVDQIGHIAMGSASDGPLLVQPRTQDRFGGVPAAFKLLDPRTFKESDLKVITKRSPHAGHDHQMGVAKRPMLSADGRVICGCGVYVRTANGYESTPAHDHSTAGPEGRYLYGPGRIQTAEGAQVGELHFGHGKGVWNYSAAQGPYFFSLSQVQTAGGASRSKAELKLHIAGDRREVYIHPDQNVFDPLFDWHSGSGVFGSHVFCVPDAELLIVLSKPGDELILSKLDWKKSLEKSGRDLLYLTDSPPPAERGSAYRYLPAVRSTKGGVKARLETSPDGMKLTPDGITWDVPKGFAESSAEVLLTLTDASGQEQFHSLHITVYDPGKAPKATNGAAGPAAKAATSPDLIALKPATVAGPFKSADIPGGKATVKLPGRVKDACYGGGGRYLMLTLPDVKQVAVFDAAAGKVAKYIPLAEPDSKVAASISHLVVAAPDAQVLQRWSLKTFEKEVTVPCPVKVAAMAMGHDVDGPVVIAEAPRDRFGDGGPLVLLDPKTFKRIDAKVEQGAGGLGPHGRFVDGSTIPLRVSANGELITGAGGTYRLQGTTLTRLAAPAGYGTADGTHVLNTGTIYTVDGKQVGEAKGGHGKMVWYYPAADAPFFLSVNQLPERPRTGRGWIDVRLHIGGDQRDVVTFTDDSIFKSLVDWTGGVPPFDRHIFVMPRAKMLIVMPLTGDVLEVRRLDAEEAIRKGEKDVIAVLSRPDPARKGEVFRYLPHVVSRKDGVKAKLESGPDGMKLTADGLEWYVPAGFAEPDVKVLMLLTDASGAEAYHSFTLPVQGK
jgi:hypothetical protein